MAFFITSFKKTMGHEGGYTNDPLDRGGETYRGISRKYWPDWSGWKIIDDYKQKGNLNLEGGECTLKLQDSVYAFYKSAFWDKFRGDSIIDQQVTDELFDTSVNMGVKSAVGFLQTALNCLNRNQVLFPDLVVDGQFGSKTLSALMSIDMNDTQLLFKMLNVLQGCKYVDIMKNDTTQERFCRGWFSRVTIYKA